MASSRRHPLGVGLRQWLAAHSGQSAPRALPGRSGARERTSPRTSLAIRSRCASACALPPRLNHSVLSESIARCQRFHPALCLSQMRCGLVKRGTPCRVKDGIEPAPNFRTEGSGDGEASGATVEATGRRMADAGCGEVRVRKGVPGDRTERTGAGRRSPGMRHQPPPLADTERRKRDGAASDLQRCPRRLSPRKNRLAEIEGRRGRQPSEAARLKSAASVRRRRIGPAHCPMSGKKEGFSGKGGNRDRQHTLHWHITRGREVAGGKGDLV